MHNRRCCKDERCFKEYVTITHRIAPEHAGKSRHADAGGKEPPPLVDQGCRADWSFRAVACSQGEFQALS